MSSFSHSQGLFGFIYARIHILCCGVHDLVFAFQLHELQREMGMMQAKMESMRDTAIIVMAHGGAFQSQVQPRLSAINQQWDQLVPKLKVCYFALILCSFKHPKQILVVSQRLTIPLLKTQGCLTIFMHNFIFYFEY